MNNLSRPPTHFAAIVQGGHIKSIGVQSLAGTSKIGKGRKKVVTRHAEMDAIYKLSNKSCLMKKGARYELYSVRFRQINGCWVVGNAKPCEQCQNMLMEHGINRVIYSNDAGTLVKGDLKNMHCKPTNGTVIASRSRDGHKMISPFRVIGAFTQCRCC
jgi:deoxycytidylate deaminase